MITARATADGMIADDRGGNGWRARDFTRHEIASGCDREWEQAVSSTCSQDKDNNNELSSFQYIIIPIGNRRILEDLLSVYW